MQSHKNATRHILIISWFRSKHGSSASLYYVSARGAFFNGHDVYDWALQASSETTLPANDLKRLTELLPKLPESKAEPPIERTVLVSFHDGNKWRTETYDEATLPDQFEAVMKVIGERRETLERHKKK
jgi:hypothetical protein